MNKFIHKVKTIGNKAVQIQQAIQSVPPKIAEVRQAVASSAEELHQLRSDVQSNLNGLRAHTEERMVQAMHEIHDSTEIWESAGYHLTGMDLDLALNQRLAVHLEKVEDVPHDDIRSLLAREKRETIKCILSGLIKAEETADNIDLTNLNYHGVTVHVGAAPAIRMSWASEENVEARKSTVTSQPVATPPLSTPSVFGSFFEQRPSAAVPASPVAAVSVASSSETSVAAPTPPPESPSQKSNVISESPWGRSALDRFKKMPDLSKHRG